MFYMFIYNSRICPSMKWAVLSLFERVMNNNVELRSDWLFYRFVHRNCDVH